MRAAIHQPHYFPWLGYFDKMAKADTFVLLDEVQLEKNSLMLKNRVIATNGELKFLTISADTKNYLAREYREIQTKDAAIWKERQLNAVKNYYRKASGYREMLPLFEQFLSQDFPSVCQWTCGSIALMRQLLGIQTPLVYQSAVDYDRSMKRSDLVYGICKAIGADTYFSGRGASVDYLDRQKFAENGVKIVFQDFTHPVYPQINTQDFIPGISVLDMLFNCGVEESRRIFWETVRSSHEFDEIEA